MSKSPKRIFRVYSRTWPGQPRREFARVPVRERDGRGPLPSHDWRYHPGTFFYDIVGLSTNLVSTCLFRWQVEGQENVPDTGPVIIAPNHISNFDPPVVGTALPRRAYCMGKEELFRSCISRWVVPRVRAFPVKRGTPDRKAIKWTLQLLAMGEMVVVFPEGTRSRTGELQEPEIGISYFILKSKAPVVPIAVSGTNRLIVSGKPLPRFGRIQVRIGKPLTFEEFYDNRSREVQTQIAHRIMEEIRALQRMMPPP